MDLNRDNQSQELQNESHLDHLVKKWCFLKDEYFHGPFTDTELTEYFLSNKINHDDYILNKQDESWYEVKDLEFLKPDYIQRRKDEKLKKEREIFEKNIFHKINQQGSFKNSFIENTNDVLNNEINQCTNRQTQLATLIQQQSLLTSGLKLKQIIQSKYRSILVVSMILVLFVVPYILDKFSEKKLLKQLDLLNQNQIRQVQSLTGKSFENLGFQGKFFIIENAGQILIQFVSNVQSKIELNVKIEGVPSTLIGAFNYSKNIKINGRNGIYEPIKLSRSVPKGEYRFIVTCYDCKSVGLEPGKELVVENMFLNGQKDKSYDRELAKYHQTVRNKAKDELVYFNQVMNLYKEQVDILAFRFGNNIKQEIKVSKYWDKYYNNWLPLRDQFDSEMDRLKTEVEQGDIFYDEIVADMQNLNFLAKEFIQILDTEVRLFFKTQQLTEDQRKKIDKAKDLVYKKINSMVDRISNFEKMPLSSNGMPQKN